MMDGVFYRLGHVVPGSNEPQPRTYYMVQGEWPGELVARILGRNFSPLPGSKPLDAVDLLEDFRPEPAFYVQSLLKARDPMGYRPPENPVVPALPWFMPQDLEDLHAANLSAALLVCRLQVEAKNIEEAGRCLASVLDLEAGLDEEHAGLLNQSANELRRVGAAEDAVRVLRKALTLAPGDENLHLNMARAFQEKGDDRSAMVHVDKALALAPDSVPAKRFKTFLARRG